MIGEEVSIIAICDGKSFKILEPCRDDKRIFDNDKGPNTGGMGSYSPVSDITDEEIEQISKKIFEPTINGMIKNGNPFKGFLYAGLLLKNIQENHISWNIMLEWEDPKCQPLMMRMESDLFAYHRSR